MKRIFSLVLIVMMIGLLSTVSYGGTLGYGARALGMGGAYTAIADDGTAPYWNPAGITQKLIAITPSLALQGDPSKALEILQNTTFPPNFPELNLDFQALGGVTTKWLAVTALVDVDAVTTDDTGSATEYGYLVLTGAHQLGGGLAVGANFKKIFGQSMSYEINSDPNLTNGVADGMAFDLGVLYRLKLPFLGDLVKVGAVARNLGWKVTWTDTKTPYNFDGLDFVAGTPESPVETDITMPPTYAAGVALRVPLIGTMVAGDYEITDGTSTIHLGVEQSLLLLKVRAGMFTDGELTGYTGGLGLALGPLLLDAAVVKSDNLGIYITGGFKL